MGRKWTDYEDGYLRSNTDLPDDILARKFQRTPRAVYDRRKILNLPPQNRPEGILMPAPLTEGEKMLRIKKLAREMRVKLNG